MTRLGFAGVGWLGGSLIADLPNVPGLELAAVQDANADLAREVGSKHAVPWTTEYDALLASGLDAIVISTPNALHAAQAVAALRAGLDVLVQKPLATSAADARAVAAAAREGARVLFVDHTYRFLETTRALANAVGAPREPLELAFHNVYGPGKAWARDRALSGGGALMDLGVHLIDLALLLVRPRAVHLETCELGRERGYAVEDRAELRLRLDDVPVRVDVSWEATIPRTEIAVRTRTDAGEVAWENVDGSFFRFRTRIGDRVLIDRETTLRIDTLRAFADALASRRAPELDLRVHDLIDEAYARGAASLRAP